MPRFFTFEVGCKSFPRMLTGKCATSLDCCCFVPIRMNSGLSGFNFNLFSIIHDWTADRHFCSVTISEPKHNYDIIPVVSWQLGNCGLCGVMWS